MKDQLVKLFKEHNIKEFMIENPMERGVSLVHIMFYGCPEYLKVKYELTGLYSHIRINRQITITAYVSDYYYDTYAMKASDYEYYNDIIRDFFKSHFDILRYGDSGKITIISPRHKIKLYRNDDKYKFIKD